MWMLAWRQKKRIAITARSACIGTIVTAMIIDAGRLGLHAGESVTIYKCWH